MASSRGGDGVGRRARLLLLAAPLLVAMGVIPGATTGITPSSHPAGVHAEPPTEAAAASRGGPEPRPQPTRLYGVGRQDLTLVDPSRPTPADPNRGRPALPERTIPTIVLYPTAGDASLPAQVGTPVARGRFPLVVFSHGLTASGAVYAPLVEPLVRAGYVLALPTFPLSSGPAAMQADVVNQPADVSFVIDELLRLSRGRGEDRWLRGHLDQQRIAAAGHSLGAVTTLGVVHNSCCIDDRIDAAVSVAGGPLPYEGGEYTWPETPTLLVHGARDLVVPVAGSDVVFDLAGGPVWYLRFHEADHLGVGLGDDGVLTMQAAISFLDAVLVDRWPPLESMAGAVAESGRADWRVRRAADQPTRED
jgi:dienelactone hydrolase